MSLEINENKSDAEEASNPAPNQLLEGYSDMDQFTRDGFKTLIDAIKCSNSLPTGRDWDYYNVHDSFRTALNTESDRVLHLMGTIMTHHNVSGNVKQRIMDEKIELIVDANDVILEKVANHIDEMNGIKRSVIEPVLLQTVSAEVSINESWNRAKISVRSDDNNANNNGGSHHQSPANCIRLLTGKNIVRPQSFFKDKIDNTNDSPWKPRITDKPNSLKPLAIYLEECDDRQEFSHPYELELERFQPLPEQLKTEKPIKPKPIIDTPLIEVNNIEQLNDLVETLRHCQVFAVDVEHHSYRSFMGITCLLQISTIDTDYIIDTLLLRDKLYVLNEVFTKPTIVKIFHGADRDIEWLQRDLSVYVVNMFDTFQASKLLEYPQLSLAYLMRHFCDFSPNKQYQLADWRIRPLPNELKNYAREDTHYLIYIYQMLKNELLRKKNGDDSLLKVSIERSTTICKTRYFKDILRDDSHLNLYRKCRRLFDNRQLYALKELYAWRDTLSRREDESTGYVLPNHMLLQICEVLPREMQGILACCNPIPPLVRSNLIELHKIVLKAREQPFEQLILKEDTRARGCMKQISKININSSLHCPFDTTKLNEFRDDLPTLLNNNGQSKSMILSNNEKLSIENTNSIYSVFNHNNDKTNTNTTIEKEKAVRGIHILSPFDRYKLIKPFIEEEEKKAATAAAAAAAKMKETSSSPVLIVNEILPLNTVNDRTNSGVTCNNNNPTDEERIASVRDHFLTMSKQFAANEQIDNAVSNEVENSRKRKREEDDFEEINLPNDNKVVDKSVSSTPQSSRFVNRKRKQNSNEVALSEDVTPIIQGAKRKKPKYKKKNKQQQQKNNCGNNKGGFPLCDQFQPDTKNNHFAPYDYSNFDYKQFQGGAGKAQRPNEFHGNFRGKGQRGKGKNKGVHTRSFTYQSNRGRGRGKN